MRVSLFASSGQISHCAWLLACYFYIQIFDILSIFRGQWALSPNRGHFCTVCSFALNYGWCFLLYSGASNDQNGTSKRGDNEVLPDSELGNKIHHGCCMILRTSAISSLCLSLFFYILPKFVQNNFLKYPSVFLGHRLISLFFESTEKIIRTSDCIP